MLLQQWQAKKQFCIDREFLHQWWQQREDYIKLWIRKQTSLELPTDMADSVCPQYLLPLSLLIPHLDSPPHSIAGEPGAPLVV